MKHLTRIALRSFSLIFGRNLFWTFVQLLWLKSDVLNLNETLSFLTLFQLIILWPFSSISWTVCIYLVCNSKKVSNLNKSSKNYKYFWQILIKNIYVQGTLFVFRMERKEFTNIQKGFPVIFAHTEQRWGLT